MDASSVIDLAREAIWITLLVSLPLLGVALVVGVVIGILQAATSINEATLSFIPKFAAVGAAMVLFGNWQLGVLADFLRDIFQRIPALFT